MSNHRVSATGLVLAVIALAGCGGSVGSNVSSQGEVAGVAGLVPSTARSLPERLSPTGRHATSVTTDWDSFGFDLQRTGYNPNETTIGVNNVASVQKLWSANVGYEMVHEPVVAAGVNVKGQTKTLLFAGSAGGSTMYAIDASTGATVWQHAVPQANYRCDHREKFQFSIGETPAIDRGKNLLYFSDGYNQVHAVDLATGTEAAGWPLTVANHKPEHNFMHGGLTYNPSNGMLYAVTSSTCDISPWYGRIVAIDTNTPSLVGTFFTMSGTATQGRSGGGIWGPGGASIDPETNNVFVATGNADTTMGLAQNAGYAEEVVELSPTLNTIVAHNYPTNIPQLDGDEDFDFGATPLLFRPQGCPLLLAAVNKSGMFELYDVGTLRFGPIQYIAMSIPTNKGDFVGVPAYDPATGYVYVGMPASEGIYKPGLAAFGIQANCTLNPTPAWSAYFGPDGAKVVKGQTPRSPISIANGVVYVSNYSNERAFAFDAATGAQLWTVGLSDLGNIGTVIANGVLYVSSRDGTITAWGPPASKGAKAKIPQGVPGRERTGVAHYLAAYSDREAAAAEALDSVAGI
ncbi:MAG TPA: PQQ-binding-like beta-propeller repeat protein [Candidatus Cybelea sp.]|jgi:outer membrane protein assembly factor BamB|nr:PQQ-binding-like beta-propeller repeat protein [Candidatus Cybelea sp.]